PPPRPRVASTAPSVPHVSRAKVRALERRMARPWPQVQARSGTYFDYTDDSPTIPDTRYGDAMMGYALVRAGRRLHDPKLIRSGLRGVAYGVAHWAGGRKTITQSVFENWAVPATYNLARRRLAKDSLFVRQRPLWEDWLRVSRAERSGITTAFGNHWLVDAAGVWETLRTGLRSPRPHAVLGGERNAALAGALSLVNERIPDLAPRGPSPFVLDDPPDNPLAYAGLSLGMYAHLVQLLGDRADRHARDLLRRAAYGLWYATAPDGDAAYFGRSQEMVFAPAATAYGALVAANLKDTEPGDAARLRELADRSLVRLEHAYPIGRSGQHYVPGLARNASATVPWLDDYAGAPSMDGIALAMVDLALGEMRRRAERSQIAADRSLAGVLGSGSGSFAVVRRGRVWFSVRLQASGQPLHAGDLRYDAGLATAKRRDDEGEWTDVVPTRPKTRSPALDSAGPDVVRGAAVVGVPIGDAATTASGRVRVTGSIRDRRGRPLAPYRASYVATGCGVELRFAARPGLVYEYSAFFRGRDLPDRRGGGEIRGGGLRVSASPDPVSVVLQRGYGSAVDPRLVRARMRFSLPRPGTVSVTMC
ncbi:MAG TPA: hypothetical protein VJT75_13370, partial [Thermoleophilaceae bacterium]|nr:hypothetical protein [Thermoleophilaceae bacterium]